MAKRKVTMYEAFPGSEDTWSVRINGLLYRAGLSESQALVLANKLRIKEGKPGYVTDQTIDLSAHYTVTTYFKYKGGMNWLK